MFNPKGKQRLVEDPWDLDPVITYRHLLSKTPAVHNPLRVIALVDNDAFYASAERVRLGLSEETPLVVQQWQALIAVSYKAREYGIKRMETVSEAKKKCPELVAVHTATYREGDAEPAYHENPDVRTHKVSLDHYRRESKKIVNVYRELLPPGGEIEKASIDECFFDLTLPVRDLLVKRYPHLGQVPPDAPLGLDTPLPKPSDIGISWDGLGNLIPILHSEPLTRTSQVEQSGNTVAQESRGVIEEAEIGLPANAESEPAEPPHENTWSDVALSIGAEIILRLRMQVKERLGYTTSGGIARNKVLAKLVASYKKRDTQSVLCNAAIPGYWRPMPIQKIRFLGGKLGEQISNAFEAQTVGQLEYLTLEEMQRKFGEESIWVWNLLRGVDYTEVSEEVANKSMLSSKNIRPPVLNVEDGDRWLRMLAGDLAIRLTEAREISPTMWPKTFTIGIRQDRDPYKSRQCPFPYTRNFSVDTITALAQKLWREITVGKQPLAKIHNISLAFHGLASASAGQKLIEGFFVSGAGGATRPDEPSPKKRPRVVSDSEGKIEDEANGTAHEMRQSYNQWETEADVKRALELLKMEHADYHFALDLAHQGSEGDGDDVDVEQTTPRSRQKKKKSTTWKQSQSPSLRRKEPPGIARYFGASSSSVSTTKGSSDKRA